MENICTLDQLYKNSKLQYMINLCPLNGLYKNKITERIFCGFIPNHIFTSDSRISNFKEGHTLMLPLLEHQGQVQVKSAKAFKFFILCSMIIYILTV